jgi:ABC-type Fe3+ transport system substrate-binding protein
MPQNMADRNLKKGPSRISRRKFIGLVGGAAAALGIGAGAYKYLATSSTTEEAEELAVMMAGGSWGEWWKKIFGDTFERQYGTKIAYIYGDELTNRAKVVANKDKQIYDAFHSDQIQATAMGMTGLFEPVKDITKWLPHASEIFPAFKFDYEIGKIMAVWGLGVNKDKISEDITSWRDLENPKYKGKIALPYWTWQGEMFFHCVNKALFGKEASDPDECFQWLAKLVKQNGAKLMNKTDQGVQMFTTGEIWLAPFWNSRTYQVAREGGPNMEFVYPKEGAMANLFNTNVIRNAPHLQSACKLYDLSLQVDVQIQFADLSGYVPTNVKVLDDPRYIELKKKKPELDITLDQMKAMAQSLQIDYVTLFKRADEYAERWNKEVWG